MFRWVDIFYCKRLQNVSRSYVLSLIVHWRYISTFIFLLKRICYCSVYDKSLWALLTPFCPWFDAVDALSIFVVFMLLYCVYSYTDPSVRSIRRPSGHYGALPPSCHKTCALVALIRPRPTLEATRLVVKIIMLSWFWTSSSAVALPICLSSVRVSGQF